MGNFPPPSQCTFASATLSYVEVLSSDGFYTVCCACADRRMIKSLPSVGNFPTPSQCTFASATLSYACIDVLTNFWSLVHNFLPRRPSRHRHSRGRVHNSIGMFIGHLSIGHFSGLCESPCPCTCPANVMSCVCAWLKSISGTRVWTCSLISGDMFFSK